VSWRKHFAATANRQQRVTTHPGTLAADGTPLAARIAIHHDGRPRPGIVLVPGMAQTKDVKFVVELAELFARNGWHVLAIDLRGHGESRNLSPAMTTLGWKETEDVLLGIQVSSRTPLLTQQY
jgi:predicted alpha/beta-fold hydrolase